ncbi:MAG: hypothetical protein AAFR21_08990 [Pseudomonadota bacterium]
MAITPLSFGASRPSTALFPPIAVDAEGNEIPRVEEDGVVGFAERPTASILFEAIDKEALIKEAVAANLAVQDSLDSLRSFVESLSAEDLEPAPAMSEFSLL